MLWHLSIAAASVIRGEAGLMLSCRVMFHLKKCVNRELEGSK
jgi:hypothetical protein